ncbi:uncharacterized protein LOC113303294 isoform X1 [Papaver somniferum]|uniref:uncharacterized protein LOC113303294 isoform X1 n=1 Tax=Papaver somniferum TaxID=3469 RepID=UPI000E6F64A0|nr:uncharacterized protein LOC113303294 isoform X1 [Papaver somniferum]XP_026408106.1 uncharacterized protein LOC113303294 isoform X1 [Papaver somniferum]
MKTATVSSSCFHAYTSAFLQYPNHMKPAISNSNMKSSKFNRNVKSEIEIRVCVNKACSKQGSRETLEILSGISPPNIIIKSCGCLGKCGSGPNLVVLPEGVLVSHVGTPMKTAQVLACFSTAKENDPQNNLKSLALRKKADAELDNKNYEQALVLLSQAAEIKPFGGLHLIYKSRSSARLGMGDVSGALEDAKKALNLAPRFTQQAYICQGDAFLEMEEFDAAEKSYSSALQTDPSIRRSKSFKARIAKLHEKLAAADLP